MTATARASALPVADRDAACAMEILKANFPKAREFVDCDDDDGKLLDLVDDSDEDEIVGAVVRETRLPTGSLGDCVPELVSASPAKGAAACTEGVFASPPVTISKDDVGASSDSDADLLLPMYGQSHRPSKRPRSRGGTNSGTGASAVAPHMSSCARTSARPSCAQMASNGLDDSTHLPGIALFDTGGGNGDVTVDTNNNTGDESDFGLDHEEELAPAVRKHLRLKRLANRKRIQGSDGGRKAPGAASRSIACGGKHRDERVLPEDQARRKAECEAEKAQKVAERASAKAKKAAEKNAEKEHRAAEREAKREDAKRKREEKLQAEIAARFEKFESGAQGSAHGAVAIVVPELLVAGNRAREKLRGKLDAVFPGQVVVDANCEVVNAIRWKRRALVNMHSQELEQEWRFGPEVDFAVVVFEADIYCENLQTHMLESLATHVAGKLKGQRIEFVLQGISSYCKTAANRAARGENNDYDMILTEEIVRDSAILLYMEYSIVTRFVKDADELVDYLISLTQRIAAAPFRKPLTFLEANREYRRYDGGGTVAGEDVSGELRTELDTDLGTMYLAFLRIIPGISMEVALSIREVFPTLRQLLDAYGACANEAEHSQVIADVQGKSGRRIGPQMSRLVGKMFTSKDGKDILFRGQVPSSESWPGDTGSLVPP